MTTITNCLFVSGLNFKTKERDLRDLFETCGEIKSIEIAKTYDNVSKGFGYITFEREQDAELAIQTLYGTHLQHRRLHLEYCRPKLRIRTMERKEEKVALQKIRDQEELERAKQLAMRMTEKQAKEIDDSNVVSDPINDEEVQGIEEEKRVMPISLPKQISKKTKHSSKHTKKVEKDKKKTSKKSKKKKYEYSSSDSYSSYSNYSDYSSYSDYSDYSDYSSYYSDYSSYSYSSDYSPSPKRRHNRRKSRR